MAHDPLASELPPDGIQLTPLIRMSRSNPYPAFEKLRAKGPIYYSAQAGVFLVSGLREAHQVLKDPRMGRNALLGSLLYSEERTPESLALFKATILFTDPPDHGRVRAFMSRAFQPRVLENLRGAIAGIVDALLDRMARKRKVDIVDALALPMPVEVIAKLIGVPREDWDKCIAWSGDLAALIDAVVPRAVVERAVERGAEFAEYFRDLVDRRRRKPEDDILSSLVRGLSDEDGLTEEELVSNVITLFTAGHETTTNLISNTFVLLSQFPDERARFEADPGRHLEGLVEESLRYEAPVQLAARVLREATQIGELRIGAGQTMWVLIGAANRDPERFADAQRFDITRSPNPHISFGSGIHFCIGAALARMEALITFERFFQRFPKWRLAKQDLQLRHTTTLRGYQSVLLDLKGR